MKTLKLTKQLAPKSKLVEHSILLMNYMLGECDMSTGKVLTKFFIIFAFLIVVTGCLGGNRVSELKSGRYVMQDTKIENSAWVLLKEDNNFEFNRSLTTSYVPIGHYLVENNLLKLIVNEDEIYTFSIDGNKLIFKGSNMGSKLVKEGAIFKLSNKD